MVQTAPVSGATVQRYRRFALPLLVSGDSGLSTYEARHCLGVSENNPRLHTGYLALGSEVLTSILRILSSALPRLTR